jgi:hypothetical protein
MIYHINEVSEEVENQQIKVPSKERKCIQHFCELKKEVESNYKKKDDSAKLSLSEIYEVLGTITYFAGQVGNHQEKISKIFGKYKPKLRAKIPDSIFSELFSLLEQYKYI